jgi:hypothetical protein
MLSGIDNPMETEVHGISWPAYERIGIAHTRRILHIDSVLIRPVTLAARSKARNVFARLNTGIVGSNPARGMDVCLPLFCVCVVLCR